MRNYVDLASIPVFYLKEREVIKNLEYLSINTNLVVLNATLNKNLVFEKKENINILKEVNKQTDNNILVVNVNLGRFVLEHSNILEDFATCYLINKNLEHLNYIKSARPFENINNIKLYKLNDEYKNLNINNINKKISEIDYTKQKVKKTKYSNNKTLEKLVLQWIKVCGLTKGQVIEIKDLEKENDEELKEVLLYTLSIETLLNILDLSLTIYNEFMNYYENNIISNPDIKVIYHIEHKNGNFEIKKTINDLLSLVTIMITTYREESCKNLRCCEYCNSYFFGRKNKKCCSNKCKDLKNKKYERRKERKKK